MADAEVSQQALPFESATELREAHARLLDALDHELGQDASTDGEAAALSRLEPQVQTFLARGEATGVFIEEVKERTACQVLLDYWVSSLSQAGRGGGSARLARFDGEQLPDLKDKPNPYVGLDAFRDPTFFFGREADTQALLTQLERAPLVVVLGASGSGKSSLVIGGVVPAVATKMPPPGLCVIPPLVPGNSVLEHLANAVRLSPCGACADPGTEAAALRHAVSRLRGMVSKPGAQPVLIIIDQFEELFTLSDAADREALVANLADLLDARLGHRVILTMREEFRSRMVELEPLSAYMDKAWYQMRPMGYAELRAAVEKPAALVNLQFQSGIVDDLAKKVLGQPAALPLLQFTLRALWEERDRNRITWEVYRTVGDPLHALAASADDFYDGRARETKDEVKRILLELVRVDELLEAYRQPVPKARLLQAGRANTEDVLRLLAENDYVRITADLAGADEVVEVKHESLIRNWPRLVTWIDEKRLERRERLALTQAAERWATSGRPEEGLLTGWQLAAAESVAELPELEQQFVQASREAVDRARREKEAALQREAEEHKATARRFRFLWAATIVLAGIAIYALNDAKQESDQKSLIQQKAMENEAQNRERVLQAMKLQPLNYVDDQLDLALLLAIEANRMTDVQLELRRALLTSLITNLEVKALLPGHKDEVRSVAYSPDRRTLASGSYDSTIILWDAERKRILHPPLQGHTDGVFSVAFSPNGRILASASLDRTVRLWDVGTGQLIATLHHDDAVYGVAIEKNGEILLSGSKDGTVRLWNLKSRTLEALLVHDKATAEKSRGGVYNVAFSPDGKLFASGGRDGLIVFWDTKERKQSGEPINVHRPVLSMAFSQDGKTIVSGNNEGRVDIWDIGTRKWIRTSSPNHSRGVYGIAFSPDGKKFATVGKDRAVYIRDVADKAARPERLKGYAEPFVSVDFAENGKIVTGTTSAMIVFWDTQRSHRFGSYVITNKGKATQVGFGGNGNTLVSFSGQRLLFWDFAAIKAEKQVTPTTVGVKSEIKLMVVAPNRRHLVTVGVKNNVELWDIAQQRRLKPLVEPGKQPVRSAAFSVDGNTLALAVGSEIHVLSLAGGERNDVLRAKFGGDVTALVFSPNEKTLAFAELGHGITIWDLITREPVVEPSFGVATSRLNHEIVDSLAFSPDGDILISGGLESVGFWNSKTGRPVGRRLGHHPGRVRSVAVSPDGKFLASASDDKSVLLWDLRTQQPLSPPIRAHTDHVVSVAFSPDGEWLVSSDAAGRIIRWHFRPPTWLSRACDVIGRNFSEDEWKQFFGNQERRITCPRVRANEADARALIGDRTGAERLFSEALRAASDSKDAEDNNSVCWLGSIHGFAASVMPACERAVELETDTLRKLNYQDSRGLARALTGNMTGAISDFTAALGLEAWKDQGLIDAALLQRRKDWIAALKEGRNPFDDATLKRLRTE